MLKPVITAACLCAATNAIAEPRRLAGAEISDLVSGATVELDTPIGSKLPVRYTTDGQMSGQARDLASFLGSANDAGKWWVAGDKLCHKWNRWFDAETQCLSLSKEGRTILWRSSDGRTGTASVAIAAPPRTVAAATTPRAVAATPPRVAAAAAPPRAVAAPAPTLIVPSTPAPITVAAAATPPEERAVAYTGVTPRFSRRTTAVASAVNIEAEKLAAPALAPEPPLSSGSASSSESASAEVVAVATSGQTAAGRSEASAAAPAKRAVMARSMQMNAAAKAETKQPALPSFIVANVTRNDVLNVRKGPSADHDVVGSLSPGSRNVAITGDCQSSWCPVRHESLSGWVKRSFLATDAPAEGARTTTLRDAPDAPRSCLSAKARALVDRIETQFGPVQLVSTCRAGATIAGTGRPSQHASGNAVDFKAGSRREAILRWLIANHQGGGTMTYRDMDHIHVDIGRHFVSIAGGPQWASWRGNSRDMPGRMSVGMSAGKSN